jgi:hypothetical protein
LNPPCKKRGNWRVCPHICHGLIPPPPWSSALLAFFLGALGEISPEEDYGDEKDDYDYIFDAISLEEIHIPVEITHHRTSLGIESLDRYFLSTIPILRLCRQSFSAAQPEVRLPDDVQRVDLGLPQVHGVDLGLPRVG